MLKYEFTIFMYHRVVDLKTNRFAQGYYDSGIVLELQNFIRQIKYIMNNYTILGLHELVNLSIDKKLPEKACCLTFDDGFIDVYTNVFPILKQHNLPAVFYIIGDPVFLKKTRWLDKFYYLLDNTSVEEFTFKWNDFYLAGAKTKDLVTVAPLKEYLRNSQADKKGLILRQLENILKLKPDWEKVNNELYIKKEQIKEMAENKLEFGAHTMTHPDLGKMDIDGVKKEIISSISHLKELFPSKPISFAYPFGGSGTFNSDIIQLLKENNIYCACTSIPGVNTEKNPVFELKRIPAEKFKFDEI